MTQRRADAAPDRWSGLLCASVAGVVFGYAASLTILLLHHEWLFASGGRLVPADFLTYWSAGKAALAGKAATAYDPKIFHALQESIAGRFSSFYFWSYPPAFFFVAVMLASLPYATAYISWIATTGVAYALAANTIARRRSAFLFALASPAALLTSYAGQNGFLTAALFGGFLVTLSSRPIVSGILIGLMTYKPQFGLLIPIALLANGQWRCMFSAALTAVVLLILAVLVFGAGTAGQFMHAMPAMSNLYLKLGGEGWQKIHSMYGIARFLGAGDRLAWSIQGALIVVSAVSVALLWRSSATLALKAAGLIAAAMLSTPYLHGYDFPVLMMALAFLHRDKPFDAVEWSIAIGANLIIAGFILQLAPMGPIAIVMVGAIVVRRLMARSHPAGVPSDNRLGRETRLVPG